MSHHGDEQTTESEKRLARTLQCMEIVGGNWESHEAFTSPGIDIYIDSRPFAQARGGGDIHYISMCGSGRVSRLALADVSGHGIALDEVAQWFRNRMRKHINQLNQARFAKAMNGEFSRLSEDGIFATALLVTYFAPTDHLIVCNAGHPPPLWYRTGKKKWQYLNEHSDSAVTSLEGERTRYGLVPISNLPLGVVEHTDYHQFAVRLEKGDWLLLYTDALIEARNAANQAMGAERLLDLVDNSGSDNPEQFSDAILAQVDAWRGHQEPEDDQTLIVIHHNASDPPKMTVGQAMTGLTKVLGFRKI